MKQNYYEILHVNENASKEMIKKAYTFLVKKYHPDLVPKDKKKSAEEMMKTINEAYDVLSDKEKRKLYDEELQAERENDFYENQIQYNVNNNTYHENAAQEVNTDYTNQYSNFLYKIKTSCKKKLKDLLAVLITFVIFAFIFFIAWKIPYTHDKLLDLYNNNSVINALCNFFNAFFKQLTGKN